jgi:feruloyl esterase
LDDFYRLFIVPGMGHCIGGPGAWRIGQGASGGLATNGLNDTQHSLLLSLIDWVEEGNAPETITGMDDEDQERIHCLWPKAKSVWDGTTWVCVDA